MTIKEKLGLVQKVSGKSQEKLAAELGVSFATLNSWINGRSVPRAKALARIDQLYLRLTGQNVIAPDALQAKKSVLKQKQKTHPDILKEITTHKDIHDELVLSLTYNTNRIEGSSLTEPETAAILFENASLPNKTLVEQMEAKNHQAALQFLFRYMEESGKLEEGLILKLHAVLLNGIQPDAGRYRSHGVRIVGTSVVTANHLKVPALMKKLSGELSIETKDPLGHAARIHSRFEQIHPFSDGNGRVGRLLLAAMALSENFPPPLIRQERRREYMITLNKSQVEDDSSLLEDFICDAVLDAFGILER